MKARTLVHASTTPEGVPMHLYEHDGAFSISFRGQELMHSKASASELLLGRLGIDRSHRERDARFMIGGLGLGFTLKAVLDGIGPDAQVDVLELLPQVVAWNREYLRSLNGALLEDPRVRIIEGDAVAHIRECAGQSYHAMMLDLDNGPTGMVTAGNNSLYSHRGLRSVRAALRPGGRAAFWSAGEDPHFKSRMQTVGFRVGHIPAKIHERAKRAAYVIYLGDCPSTKPSPRGKSGLKSARLRVNNSA